MCLFVYNLHIYVCDVKRGSCIGAKKYCTDSHYSVFSSVIFSLDYLLKVTHADTVAIQVGTYL